jgi:hypothetical protein
MFQKPKGFDRVGVIQCFLALFFVLWFFILPSQGIYFAWPVKPELTALFLGSGFLLRSYYGYHIWREKDWYKLRWLPHGDYAFLGVLFVTTWWHIYEMNWNLVGVDRYAPLRIFCLVMAHVWTLAYTFEPVTVFLLAPRGKDKEAADAPIPAELSEGPVLPFTKKTLLAIFYLCTVIFALLFFDPKFADFRWPWELNAFDSRIMAAFPAGVGVWAVTMYFMKDWAEVKIGFTGIVLFFSALFLMSIVTLLVSPWWVPGRHNIPTFPIGTGIFAALLLYSYWKQQASRPKK